MKLSTVIIFSLILACGIALCGSSVYAQIPDQVPSQTQIQNQGQALSNAATKTADSTAKSATTKAQTAKSAVAKKVGPLDINSATLEQIKAIPGLSDFAQQIVAARPFKSKLDLVKKKIVPKNIYNQIKSQITAKLPKI